MNGICELSCGDKIKWFYSLSPCVENCKKSKSISMVVHSSGMYGPNIEKGEYLESNSFDTILCHHFKPCDRALVYLY